MYSFKKIIFCLFTFAIIANASSQGCVAIRHFSCSVGNNLENNLLPQVSFQVGVNYRYFKSFRHFRGTEEEPDRVIAKIHRYAAEAGRDPAEIGIEARVCLDPTPIARGRKVLPVRSPEAAAEEARRWQELGATHVTFNSNDVGMKSADLHVDAIRRFRVALGD